MADDSATKIEDAKKAADKVTDMPGEMKGEWGNFRTALGELATKVKAAAGPSAADISDRDKKKKAYDDAQKKVDDAVTAGKAAYREAIAAKTKVMTVRDRLLSALKGKEKDPKYKTVSDALYKQTTAMLTAMKSVTEP